MNIVYLVTSIQPLRKREQKHTCVPHRVLAQSEDQALAAVKASRDHSDGTRFHVEELARAPVGTPMVLSSNGVVLRTPTQVRALLGEPEPEVKLVVRERKLSTKRLGQTQYHVLESVSKAPYPHGGWVWSTPSHTQQVLETLYLRALVDKKQVPAYGVSFEINEAGRAALCAPELAPQAKAEG